MRKRAILCALAMIVFFCAAGNARELRFAVIGDSRPITGMLPQSPPFKHMLWEIDTIAPDLTVHVGDLVFGYMSGAVSLESQYTDLTATVAAARTPIHYAIGNHELGATGGEAFFTRDVGKLWYSFDKGKSHFIILNSDCCGDGDKGTLGQEQFEWLKSDLAAAAGAANVFVFMHKPMFDNQNDRNGTSWFDLPMRDAVHGMFVKAGNVRAVFAGHIHIYADVAFDGIPYYITGGGGAETDHPERGGFYHYLLVSVRGKKMDVRVVEPYHLWYECSPACDGTNNTVDVNVINTLYSNIPLDLGGLALTMPALPEGKKYKTQGAARILSQKPGDNGTVSLRIKTSMSFVLGIQTFRLLPAQQSKD